MFTEFLCVTQYQLIFKKLIFSFFSVWSKVLKKLLNTNTIWDILHNFTNFTSGSGFSYYTLTYKSLWNERFTLVKKPLLRQRLHSTIVKFSFNRRQKNQFTLYTSVNKFRALPLLKCQGIKIKFIVIKYTDKRNINISWE